MDDQRLEEIIGLQLRIGVSLAAALVFAGGVFYLFQHHADPVSYRNFVAGGSNVRSVSGIIHGALQGDSVAIMGVGLLLLVLTPVVRVALAAVGFLIERDRLYTVVSLIVLAILVFSMVHAR